MKNKKKKRFLSRFESFMYKVCIFVIVSLIILIVFSETKKAEVNLEVQKLNIEVEKQKDVNKSLEMKIDEMTSLDRIKEVSDEFGLSYNSDNIKTIK